MNKHRKPILIIMDGWGIAPQTPYNAIANAQTPSFDKLLREYPNTSLRSDGESVGLPEGQFGTSEVNHLTIGSGRVILQDLPRINTAIKSGEFFQNTAILETITHVEKNNSKLHLLGILSDGGVHSHIEHVIALLDLLQKRNFTQPICVHVFTDGRDVPPKSAEKYLQQLQKHLDLLPNAKIATLQGRYLLDRDRDWAKTETAFKLIRSGEGNKVSNWQAAMNLANNLVNSDEYIGSYLLDETRLLEANDGLIFFHYRTDRAYQLTKRILTEELDNFSFTSFIESSAEFTTVKVAFPRAEVRQTLSEVISKSGKTQLHVTETEKFPHLTYFLNGERESEFSGEKWLMFESNRFIKPRYNYEPSMRNFEIAKAIIESIEKDSYDFIVANFSSPDMVGHTGNYNAAVVSAESVDYCLGMIYKAVENKLDDYALIITADHGNSEIMWDEENKQPHTQHTLSKVPLILVSNLESKLARSESLEDIAPTILDLLGLEKPADMTGTTLLVEE